ncbi:MBL fold metallo-hydrolase [Saccharopolyspora phatthalungensis]|uniref:Glyoxylase-like metal-dependent hydrolase (Beta-lactamase superfamily II) n=1 Tax=Saccharopolyspora phatthalungensis TaxID=664693 RepID=A0A840Q539_9PSEU|nr:MBL fold metallo-hydrolase [Saccharopolyspora phatthalungensis]MBB5155087.1 glyoxylase-like metal-dependent hydrolase (beta-lactamase superfamily II) [Saccharopolyspora phatthalungensis]
MDVVPLVPNLYLLRPEFGQAYLWHEGGSATLIDTGIAGSGSAITGLLAELGTELNRIILTHGHEDHVGSAAEIRAATGAPVLAHGADAPVVRGERKRADPVLLDWERPLFDSIPNVPPPPPCPVDEELAEGDLLDFAGGARVLSIPGHTEGSIAIYLPRNRILFTGDTIANVSQVMLGTFNVDRARTIESFHRLAELDTEVACFGHGEAIIGNAGAELRAVGAQLTT